MGGMSRTILITGANGLLGSRLAELALAAGHDVRTLTRKAWDGAPYVPLKNRFLGDLPELIPAECLVGVEIVVHCAATASTDQRIAQAVNVDGTGRLASAASAAGVKTFIHLSSSTAAGDSLSVYGRTKHAGEAKLASIQGAMARVVLRPNLIVGPPSAGVYGRMAGLVDRLPVIPLLGGGRQIVQPVHVDDLCAFMLRIANDPAPFAGARLDLGDPAGVTLAELLKRIAVSRGKRRIFVPVPLWPFDLMLGVTEAIGLKLPIGRENLQGLRQIKRADTAADMAKAGIPVRPPDTLLEIPVPVPAGKVPRESRPVRILLVGAGRIGLIHAVNISRLPDVVLAGMCDPNPKAVGLLRGLGFTAPAFRNLEAGLAGCRPDAAIIGTPPSSHHALAKACLAAGLPVLVEKPLAPDPDGVAAFDALNREFPGRMLGGYALPLAPHVAHWFRELREGRLGKVESASAVSLMTYVMAPGLKTWQMRKAASGGGVLMNPGVHALALVRGALGGWQGVAGAAMRRLHSTEVEDSLVADLDGGLASPVRVSASWSIDGFARPEHMLTLGTDRGTLRLTGAVGAFEPASGDPVIAHQIDFPAAFDLAPDFAGAGFLREIELLRDLALGKAAHDEGLPVAETASFEQGIHAIYAAARGDRFTGGATIPAVAHAASAHPPQGRLIDLRDLGAAAAKAFVLQAGGAEWAGVEVSATQLRGWGREVAHRPSLRVTVPDFLNESRMLLSGRGVALLRQLGPRGLVAAGFGAAPAVLRDRGASFWAAADGLLAADLAALPSGFDGTVLLHHSLVDLALALRRHDRIMGWVRRCRSAAPLAKVGFHTQMALETAQACALTGPDVVSMLTSPAGHGMGEAVAAVRRAGAPALRHVTAEVGSAPAVVHRYAAAHPLLWTHGADGLLVHACAEPALAPVLQREFAAGWARAFPGLAAPAYW